MNCFKKLWCRTYQGAFRLISPMLPYREPKILNGMTDVKDVLVKAGVTRVMLVTDKSIFGLGLTKPLEEILLNAKIKVVVFDGVVPNPTISCIETGLTIFKQQSLEAIIAFGGGSVMDCAKIIGARFVRPNLTVKKMKGLLKIRKKLPLFIAIPTTAGTGSEVTVAAVITDENSHKKFPINDFSLISHYAVLDPTVTLGLPKTVTAWTGLDALVHAVEAYIGKSTTKLTRQRSEEAVKLIAENLLLAYEDGSNITARSNMLRASYCAGVAFTRSYVGYVHAIAHSLGGKYGVPHGLANAIILPKMLEAYGDTVYAPLARLARIIGLADEFTVDSEACTRFINWVKDLNAKMGIPEKVKELREVDIKELAKNADNEANPLYPVPKLMGRKELEKMYIKLL